MKYKIVQISCKIWIWQKPTFANDLLKKGAGNTFVTLKSFGWKDVKAVVDAYRHDRDIAKKPNNIFQLSREISIEKGRRTELSMSLMVVIEVKSLNMFALADMAISVIKMTKLEIDCHLVVLQPSCSQLFSENDVIMKYEIEKFILIQ